VTWGGWAGLAWAAWQLCWAALAWRDFRRKERAALLRAESLEKTWRKRMADKYPGTWGR
jgi:hypothetical protein